MTRHWLVTFANDAKVHALLLLVGLDFVLGVCAAIKQRRFRLEYVANFMRDDILGKLVPYFALYVGSIVAGSEQIGIPIDLGDIAGAACVAVMASLAGSILGSVRALGLVKLPEALAGKDAPERGGATAAPTG